MTLLVQIAIYILQVLAPLFLGMIVLRFLLQLSRADFYNPFSQVIVKITNPLLIPIRRLIPGVFGIDIAAIILAILVQVIYGELVSLLLYQQMFNPIALVGYGVLGILNLTVYIFYICLIVMIVASFIAPLSTHPALNLVRQLTEPLTAPLRRIIPPMGGLDFSVLFVFLGLGVVQKVLFFTAVSVNLNPALVVNYF